jgi:outer membrane protein assembly factor BamB
MMKTLRQRFSLAAMILGAHLLIGAEGLVCAFQPPEKHSGNWGQWRGPLGTGEAPDADPPTSWSETENVRWRTAIPGKGHSTPIVWGDTVFVTAAEPFGPEREPKYSGRPGAHDNAPVSQQHRFLVIAVNRADGTIRWKKTVHQAWPLEGAHNTASLASASCVTDGQFVWAHFGSYGLYCVDFDGKIIWKKMPGVMHTKHGHGEGSSPALAKGTIVFNHDHEGQSFILALDGVTGEEIWKKQRSEVTSWSSPIILDHDGVTQVIVAGTAAVRSYRLEDGSELWRCGGLSNNVVASPVSDGQRVYVGSSYDTRALFAIKLDGATGDITGSDHVAWFVRDRTPYVPSPLLYSGAIYYLRHYQNVLSRREAESGEEKIGPFRIRGLRDIYASPVAAKDRIYISDRDGATVVFSHVRDLENDVPRILWANSINDRINASLALAGDQIFIRGEKRLYCIEEEE